MDAIWSLQFIFYILICFILAAVMRGWIGFFAGLLGGVLMLFVIFMLISGDQNSFSERGR
jgi:hypothetical protein